MWLKKAFFISGILILTLQGNMIFAQSSCDAFHVTSTPEGAVLVGQSVQLNATGMNFTQWTALPYYDFGGQETNASITVSPTQNTTFTAHGWFANHPVELVQNGGFESGNTGFGTSYTSWDANWAVTDQRYVVATNSKVYYAEFGDVSSHNGNKYMIVNGSTAGVKVWSQSINVTPHTEYELSVWCVNIHKRSKKPARLVFNINGGQLGNIQVGNRGEWKQFKRTWNSGISTTVTIEIYDTEKASVGNDFGLDDISFKEKLPPVEQCTREIAIPVIKTCQPFTINITGSTPGITEDGYPCFTVCPHDATDNHSLDLHASGNYPNSSTLPEKYEQSDETSQFKWTIENLSSTGQNCTFTPSADMEGRGFYGRVDVTDRNNCSNTAFVRIKVSKSPVTAVNIPPSLCLGGEVNFETGDGAENSIHIEEFHDHIVAAKKGVSKKIFLPDGIACDGKCDYTSSVKFNGFPENATVESVDDIEYLRLNIEHSCIGDLTVKLTCPNSQSVTVLREGWTDDYHNNSACGSLIPLSDRGWHINYYELGKEDEYRKHFGFTGRYSNGSEPCDPNAANNQAGIGWNYCWSNNTGSEYMYNEGKWVYAESNHIANYVDNTNADNKYNAMDSSNVAAKSNFFHPDESFDALIGCPLNGEWTVTVQDAASWDNGYLFEWEIVLAAESDLPDWDFMAQWASTEITGEGIQPDGITARPTTTGNKPYNIKVMDNNGCEYDFPESVTVYDHEFMEKWLTVPRSDTKYDFTEFSVYSNKFKQIDVSAVSSEYRDIRDTTMAVGVCGTVMLLHLKVSENPCEHIYSTATPQIKVCSDEAILTAQGMTSYTWTAEPFYAGLAGQEHNATIHVTPTVDTKFYVTGEYTDAWGNTISCPDKGLGVTVTILPIDHTDIEIDTSICYSDYEAEIAVHGNYMWNGVAFTDANINKTVIESRNLPNGCEELLKLKLTVFPSYDFSAGAGYPADTIVSCTAPYTFIHDGITEIFDHSESRDITFKAQNGCDSIVTIHVFINKNLTEEQFHIDCSALSSMHYMLNYGEFFHTFTADELVKPAVIHELKDYYADLHQQITMDYSPNPATFGCGTHTLTWTATDPCGNTATCTQVFIVDFPPCGTVDDSVSDADGNRYSSVRIGCDCWTGENLTTTHYSDGNVVNTWHHYLDNDSIGKIYGKLYSWYSAVNVEEDNDFAVPVPSPSTHRVQGICPEGWAIPTDEEYVRMVFHSGDLWHAKEASTLYWAPALVGQAPGSGFDARGSGSYDPIISHYESLCSAARFWTISTPGSILGSATSVQFGVCEYEEIFTRHKGMCFSVRCVRIE